MANHRWPILLLIVVVLSCSPFFGHGYDFAAPGGGTKTAYLKVDASGDHHPTIPSTLFGVFFEEINHAGAGGLWAELVRNRGFEAGGGVAPSNIYPWNVIGDERAVKVATEPTSCFANNKMALRMDVMCDGASCPAGGAGIVNPGYWGMNIQQGKSYKLVFYLRSIGPVDLTVALIGFNRTKKLAAQNVGGVFTGWTKREVVFKPIMSDPNASLAITSSHKTVVWFDQISLMPLDTYKGHGFRADLAQMVADLKPGFIRFPGGCFVEGAWLRNAVRWKETVGPWENRPGHFGDVWNYWTDDGMGLYEFYQFAEDIGALPIWVFNNGISHTDEVDTTMIGPFIQEALDGIQFAVGPVNSKWGGLRATMGHPKPFDLRYVAVGNEDCGKEHYRGNYLKFYYAIKSVFPNIKVISNCDYTDPSTPTQDPADYYDYHKYTTASDMFRLRHQFDTVPRTGPKAFVSEYAVWREDAGLGSLKAALAEAGFLMGLEKNSDIVEMAAYAPLFVNANDRKWSPDAINFDSYRAYGTPSYWMQTFFSQSNGAALLNATLDDRSSAHLAASAIIRADPATGNSYLRVKVVNVADDPIDIKIDIIGANIDSRFASKKTEITYGGDVMAENTFEEPLKIKPVETELKNPSSKMGVKLSAHSLTSFDLLLPKGGNVKQSRKTGVLS
ncbi:unnamed protein product [Linum trigynum]|uniref:non-reducing end alpha-L-arabinofuranosidase n=1 Tax=Linum trigynum TaxID=586398 RepID=A0AAV2C7F3_9ROSI